MQTIIEQLRNHFQPKPSPYAGVWRFQNVVSRRLLIWAVGNVALGVWLQQRRNKFWRGVGMQSLSWGAINAGIAIIGSGVANWRKSRMENPYAAPIVEKEHRNLFRALWINAILDVFYVLGGLALALTRGKRDRLMRGNGWGVVMQGGFLLLFDAIHAAIMKSDVEEREARQ